MTFLEGFSEWVEACFFDERDRADRQLETLLALPADELLSGSLTVLARLVEAFAPTSLDDVSAALAQHLIIKGRDEIREALIHAVVFAARSPAGRAELFARHSVEAVIGAALECGSVLAQTVADREGVVPSSVLRPL